MHKTDLGDTLSRPIRDLRAALSLLTRLPLPAPAEFPSPPAVWAWPLVGLVVGGLATLAGLAAGALGLPPALAAVTVLAVGCITTGALHEDGLADTADGLWGGWDKDRRLAIMKDSHIGSYGVMALLLVTLARWSAVAALLAAGDWPALIAAAALSRAPMGVLMAALPNARGAGLSQSVGRPTKAQAGLSVLLAAGLALGLTGSATLVMLLVAGVVTLVLARIALTKIGGQTGDILGASQQLAELAALATAVALL